MNINELIELVSNKLRTAETHRAMFFEQGNVDGVNNIDADILQLNNTLEKLRSL